jgi:hypothetical protein
MVLSFTVAASPRQRSHSQVRVPRASWPHFIVLDSSFPLTGRVKSPFICSRNRVSQLYPPGTGFPFHCLLRFTGLHWKYSTPPPHGRLTCFFVEVKVKFKVTLRLAVYRQWVRLGVKPLEVHDQRFFLQLNPYGNSPYVTSSLTR